jgi:hypothetical protein
MLAGGVLLLDRDPQQARAARANIHATSIDALDEVRAVRFSRRLTPSITVVCAA